MGGGFWAVLAAWQLAQDLPAELYLSTRRRAHIHPPRPPTRAEGDFLDLFLTGSVPESEAILSKHLLLLTVLLIRVVVAQGSIIILILRCQLAGSPQQVPFASSLNMSCANKRVISLPQSIK